MVDFSTRHHCCFERKMDFNFFKQSRCAGSLSSWGR
jgi:hypothetical protein